LLYTEVQYDSPTIGDLPQRYVVAKVPTLLSFSREEPQLETMVTDLKQLENEEFLRGWLEIEARRGGEGGAGGGGRSQTLLGGLFGGWWTPL
jgi:hypothetical protein